MFQNFWEKCQFPWELNWKFLLLHSKVNLIPLGIAISSKNLQFFNILAKNLQFFSKILVKKLARKTKLPLSRGLPGRKIWPFSGNFWKYVLLFRGKFSSFLEKINSLGNSFDFWVEKFSIFGEKFNSLGNWFFFLIFQIFCQKLPLKRKFLTFQAIFEIFQIFPQKMNFLMQTGEK